MAQLYDNQLTVRVWRNVKRFRLPTSHFGHASVTLRGMFLKGSPADGRRRVHISFWPSEGAGIDKSGVRRQEGGMTEQAAQDKVSEMNRLTALRLEVGWRQREGVAYPKKWDRWLANQGVGPLTTPRKGQVRLDDTFDDGWPIWSQSPENKIVLPGFNCGRQGRSWGLSISRANKWWEAFQQTDPHYKALSTQNCAGIALMALQAAGSEAFEPLPSVRLYAEPAQVERYAMTLQAALDQLERMGQGLDKDVQTALATGLLRPDMLAGAPKGDLWSLEEWKRRSALGPLQPRSGTIRDIDAALAQFHQHRWDTGHALKYGGLADVVRGIARHRQAKPDSARSVPLLQLAIQALSIVRNPGPHW